jgi:hypothetical protein
VSNHFVRVEMISEVAVAKLVRCVHEMAEASADAGIDRFVSPPVERRS